MDVIKQHAEMAVFVLVVLVCAGFFVAMKMAEPGAGTLPSMQLVKEKLDAKEVSAAYLAGVNDGELKKYHDNFTKNLKRPWETETNMARAPQFTIYPRPQRPEIDKKTKPHDATDVTCQEFAVLGELSEIKTTGDHGRVLITYKLPANMKYMDVIRVEIFRGVEANKIDTQTPDASWVYLDEDKEVVEAPPAASAESKPAKEPAGEAEVRSTGDRRRLAEAEREIKAAGPAPDKEPKKSSEVPAELQEVRVYADMNVDEKKPYYYRLRLIGRMRMEPGYTEVKEKDAKGNPSKIIEYMAPNDGINIPAKTGDSKRLFATPLTDALPGASLTDYEIRYTGADQSGGKLAPLSAPDWERDNYGGYRGRFEVKVWIREAKEYKTKYILAAKGAPIKGAIPYKVDKQDKMYQFDSNYVLVEIKTESRTREREVLEIKKNANGDPVLDQFGKPEMVPVKKEDPSIIDEFAVLKYLPTAKLEEFHKVGSVDAQAQRLAYLAKLLKQQEEDQDERKKKQQALSNKPAPARPSAINQPPPGRPNTPPSSEEMERRLPPSHHH